MVRKVVWGFAFVVTGVAFLSAYTLYSRRTTTVAALMARYRVYYVKDGDVLPVDCFPCGVRTVGLDVEHTEDGVVRVVQVATHGVAVVYQVGPSATLPPALVDILQDPLIVKAGAAIDEDVRKIVEQNGVVVTNTFDVGRWGRKKLGRAGLAFLTQELLRIDCAGVKRPELTVSDWSAVPLSAAQVQYAAFDAIASYEVMLAITRLPPDPISKSERNQGKKTMRRVLSDADTARHARGAACTLLRSWRNRDLLGDVEHLPCRTIQYRIDFGAMMQLKEGSRHRRGVMRCEENGVRWKVRRHGWTSFDDDLQSVIEEAFQAGEQSVSIEIRVSTDRVLKNIMDEGKVGMTVLPEGKEAELIATVCEYLGVATGGPGGLTQQQVMRVAAGCGR